MYNPEFEDLIEKYKRPFFFKAQKSYKDIEYLQIGDQLIYLKGQEAAEGRFVNNLFDAQAPTHSTKINRETSSNKKPAGSFSIKEKIKNKKNQ